MCIRDRILDVSPIEKKERWSLRAALPEKSGLSDAKYSDSVRIFREKENASRSSTPVKVRCPEGQSEKPKFSELEIEPSRFNIPVYFGIGLRLKANVTVLSGSVNLSSLPAITAAVSANNATGTMSVQTIGISGNTARSNLLLLDKIDSTTIQNAIQVLASIKASIESEDTTITPRIVGFHNTIGAGAQGVNLIHSLLSSDTENWLEINQASSAAGEVDL